LQVFVGELYKAREVGMFGEEKNGMGVVRVTKSYFYGQ